MLLQSNMGNHKPRTYNRKSIPMCLRYLLSLLFIYRVGAFVCKYLPPKVFDIILKQIH